MKFSIVMITAILGSILWIPSGGEGEENASPLGKIVYPTPKRSDQKENYFGTEVADPYRWMETDSPELSEWIDEENKITEDYLSRIPFRSSLREELTRQFNYEKRSIPFKKGEAYFYFKNSGLQNQPVLYRTDDLAKEPILLLDPNKLSDDGTVALNAYAVSKDGKYLAYSVSRSGSDWQEAFVLDIETGEKLPDHLKWLKFTDLSWAGDGFYYSRYPEPDEKDALSGKNQFHQVWFHRVGTDQSEDQLLFLNQNQPNRNCWVTVDEEENFLFLSETESTYGNRLLYRDLRKPESPFVEIFDTFEAETSELGVRNGLFYLVTDYNAPRRRIVEVNPSTPDPSHWRDIVPEGDSLLNGAVMTGDKIAVTYLTDATSEVAIYDFQGRRVADIPLPGLGVVDLSGKKGDPELFLSFTSFVYPTVIYRYEESSGEEDCSGTAGKHSTGKLGEVFPLPEGFHPEDYVTDRLWFTSKDGTRAPLFVTYKKGTTQDGENPALLYGYGGFNINMSPMFKPEWKVYLDHGGVLAVAVLRGGGEYGTAWHQAGTKERKQNVFDDFIAAAEFLIDQKWTSSRHLAILGRSNGGLLVGAAMTQRPDLFQVAVPGVGVLDMLRYHRFTIGWAWAVDYGTSEDSPEMFDALYAYSPLHRIRPGVDYPATLILTADHDDRVVPAHSFKFAATLQDAISNRDGIRDGDGSVSTGGGRNLPALIRIETKAGHGGGKPLTKVIDEATDVYSFILFLTASGKE